MINWQDEIRRELADAKAAREAGNEGRARVCARRVAGIAAREWLIQQGVQMRSTSAYEVLKTLAGSPALAPDLRQAAVHLTMRVTEAFSLPESVDLIEEALLLVKKLGAMTDVSKITFYGTEWCFDCHRARRFFEEHQILYQWVNIDRDPQAETLVKKVNHGYRSVPTIVWPDGSILVEPSNRELAEKLGIKK